MSSQAITRLPDISLLLGLLLIRLLQFMLPWPEYSGPVFLLSGWVLIVAGATVGISVLSGLRQRGTSTDAGDPPSQLIKTGSYGFSRNPYYLACAVLLTGVALLTGAMVTFLIPLAYVLVINRFVMPVEEVHLLMQFGAEYEEYRRHVRRWI